MVRRAAKRRGCTASANIQLVLLLGLVSLTFVLAMQGHFAASFQASSKQPMLDHEVNASQSAVMPGQRPPTTVANLDGLDVRAHAVAPPTAGGATTSVAPLVNIVALEHPRHEGTHAKGDVEVLQPRPPKEVATTARPQAANIRCNDGYKHAPCFDVEACAAHAPPGGRYAFVLAHLGLPKWPWLTFIDNMKAQAEMLAVEGNASVDIVLLMPSEDARRLGCQHKNLIKFYEVRLIEIPWTIPPAMRWTPWYWKAHTWCGPQDLMRLHALGLEGYDAVAYYDQDIEFHGSVEAVLRCAASGHFLSTSGGVEEPLNVGFFALRPDQRLLQAAIWFAQNVSYSDQTGWGDSGFAPAGSNFVGSQCGQGFFHTLFYKQRSVGARQALAAVGLRDGLPQAQQIDRCIWNYQSGHQCPVPFKCGSIQVHHKPTGKPQGRDCPKLALQPGAQKRARARPPPRRQTCVEQCVHVGANCQCNSPNGHVKVLEVAGVVQFCEPSAFNPAGDVFGIDFAGSAITITRRDSRSCWCDGDLYVQCCIMAQVNASTYRS